MSSLPQPETSSTRLETPSTMPYARQNRKTRMIAYREQKEKRYLRQCDTPNQGEPTLPQTSYMETNDHKPLQRKLSCSAQPSSQTTNCKHRERRRAPYPPTTMAKGYPKSNTRCDHILIIKQSTRARRARIGVSKGSIPGDTRLLPLTLRGSTTIRVSPKGMAGGDSRHHQKDWQTG